MWKHLFATWKSNQGNLLLLYASVATTLVSSIWYFDLLPKIELITPSTQSTPATVVQRRPATLIATIIAPNMQINDAAVNGFVRVYAPNGLLTDGLVPETFGTFKIDDSGVDVLVFNDLDSGNYSAVAFLDINANGELDCNDRGTPIEPFRFSSLGESISSKLDLESASFSLGTTTPLNLKFDFRPPNQ